jgi:hypothetical protein
MASALTHNETCRHCKTNADHPVTLTPEKIHYGRVDCGTCGRLLRWLPKPDGEPSKYKRQAAHRNLVADYGRGFCELCLRKVGELPPRQTLEAQHVIEYQDEGSNKRENIWILCTACHKLVHWMRIYHGKVSPVEAIQMAAEGCEL